MTDRHASRPTTRVTSVVKRYAARTGRGVRRLAHDDERLMAAEGFRARESHWVDERPRRRFGRRTLEVTYTLVLDVDEVLVSQDLVAVTDRLTALQRMAIEAITRGAHPTADPEERRSCDLDRMAIDHLVRTLQAHRAELVVERSSRPDPAA